MRDKTFKSWTPESMAFANVIREKRYNKGMTQYELSEALGFTHNIVARWESAVQIPNAVSLIKICKILDINIETFDKEIQYVRANHPLFKNMKEENDIYAEM